MAFYDCVRTLTNTLSSIENESIEIRPLDIVNVLKN